MKNEYKDTVTINIQNRSVKILRSDLKLIYKELKRYHWKELETIKEIDIQNN